MNLQSYGRSSRNENGHEEVSAHFHQTFWQWLTKKPVTEKVWYRVGQFWFDKATGKLVPEKEQSLIYDICYELDRIKFP